MARRRTKSSFGVGKLSSGIRESISVKDVDLGSPRSRPRPNGRERKRAGWWWFCSTLGRHIWGYLFFVARFPLVLAAEFSDDVSNNLFSDLAPLLALFGEQVAKQFLASSTTWEDNIIFAMGPLGIVTAVVSAIRIGGPLWLRAIIGRARESRAMAEDELTTSTSEDVCEIWNGQAVVRLVGSPRILQLAYVDNVLADPESRVLSLETEAKSGHRFVQTKISAARLPVRVFRALQSRMPFSNGLKTTDVEARQHVDSLATGPTVVPPNLSLNIQAALNTRSRFGKRIAVLIGVILQSGVLIFAGFATYHPKMRYQKEGEDIEDHAFPLAAVGTIVLVLGMWICSYVVESSTFERKWELQRSELATGGKTSTEPFRIIWLQQGGSVTDQQFDSYAIVAEKPAMNVITRRLTTKITDVISSQSSSGSGSTSNSTADLKLQNSKHQLSCKAGQATSSTDPSNITQLIATIGTFISLGGFAMQFTGLRYLHFSATISQLVITAIMVAVRAWIRRGLTANVSAYKIPRGYEMDWLATRLASEPDKLWTGCPNEAVGIYRQTCLTTTPAPLNPISPMGDSKKATVHCNNSPADIGCGDCTCSFLSESCWGWGIETGRSVENFELKVLPALQNSNCHKTMKLRERIGQISRWTGSVSEAAVALSAAIEVVMNALFCEDGQAYESLAWNMQGLGTGNLPSSSVSASTGPPTVKPQDADLRDDGHIWLSVRHENGTWSCSATEIEAVLSLWLFAVQSKRTSLQQQNNGKDNTTADDWLRKDSNFREPALRLLGATSTDSTYFRDLRWYMGSSFAELRGLTYMKPTDVTSTTGQTVSIDSQLVLGFSKVHGAVSMAPASTRIVNLQNLGDTRPTFKPVTADDTFGITPVTIKEPSISLGVYVEGSIEKHLVQDMFSTFMWAVSKKMRRLEGKTVVNSRRADGTPLEQSQWQEFQLHNEPLWKMAGDITAAAGPWLGEVQDVLWSLVPPLSVHDKLPASMEIIDRLRDLASPFEALGSWSDAVPIYLSLAECCRTFRAGSDMRKHATAILFDFSYNLSEARRMREEFNVDDEVIAELKGYETLLLDALWAMHCDGDRLIQDLLTLYRIQRRPRSPLLALETRFASHGTPILETPFKGFCGATPWHKAALEAGWGIRMGSGKSSDIKQLQEITVQDDMGLTPLHYYLLLGEEEWDPGIWHMIRGMRKYSKEELESLHFELNTLLDVTGWSVLHYAVAQQTSTKFTKSMKGLMLLLELYSSIRTTPNNNFSVDLSGRTALHYAQNIEGARELIIRSGTVLKVVGRDQTDALLAAVKRGSSAQDVTSFLLDSGANPRVVDSSRATALHWAAHYGLIGVIKKLRKKGADLNARDDADRTPFLWTRASGVLLGKPESLWDLLEVQDDDTETRDARGYSIVHLGVKSGVMTYDSLSKVIGANSRISPYRIIDARDINQLSPLAWAAAKGEIIMAGLLLKGGAAIDDAVAGAEKPLSVAIKHGQKKMVEFLLSRGAKFESAAQREKAEGLYYPGEIPAWKKEESYGVLHQGKKSRLANFGW
ncbi:hypothetical protein BJ508DRAFT_223080 [Ascobolus immersus RN42]|uniref:Uncharacterized protein n=1 Tax=Ascobolus immersus RN42 TaxID=1160509 RepID=A0A3N4IFL9_ASCIM|nr:hypothetical protein BJ508DRAFT_223080 [Ascobolus immersus RN42]